MTRSEATVIVDFTLRIVYCCCLSEAVNKPSLFLASGGTTQLSSVTALIINIRPYGSPDHLPCSNIFAPGTLGAVFDSYRLDEIIRGPR